MRWNFAKQLLNGVVDTRDETDHNKLYFFGGKIKNPVQDVEYE